MHRYGFESTKKLLQVMYRKHLIRYLYVLLLVGSKSKRLPNCLVACHLLRCNQVTRLSTIMLCHIYVQPSIVRKPNTMDHACT
jgi:hypothetical protein